MFVIRKAVAEYNNHTGNGFVFIGLIYINYIRQFQLDGTFVTNLPLDKSIDPKSVYQITYDDGCLYVAMVIKYKYLK